MAESLAHLQAVAANDHAHYTSAVQQGNTAAAAKYAGMTQAANRSASQWATAQANTNTLNASQQSAFDLMNQTLQSWGLGSLSNQLKQLIVSGDTASDTLALALSQTPEYQARFAGNKTREAQGLPDLTPAQYIATEEQYRQVLQQYGLPKGFYDSPDDFTKMIGNDISPSELSARAQIAHDQYTNAPAATQQLWETYYGTKGDAIASILDPDTATQIIQDRANTVAIGGAAAAQGLSVSKDRATAFQQNGVTLADAQKAYADIAQNLTTQNNVLDRFGANQTLGDTQATLENSDLLQNGAAAAQLKQANASESALFQGHAGTDTNSLSVDQNY